MAAAVTVVDALIAFPLAYFIARYASPRLNTGLIIAVTIPLWSSYLVRVYAWKSILAKEGILSWFINLVRFSGALDWLLSIEGIGGSSLALSPIGMFIVFAYIWLPYMILPIQTALERVPHSLVEVPVTWVQNHYKHFEPYSFHWHSPWSLVLFSLSH